MILHEKRMLQNVQACSRDGNGTESSMVPKGNEEEQALQKSERGNVLRKKRNDLRLT